LLDTLFIVLGKKDRQLTFLHCSHHCVVGFGVWYGLWYSPSGDTYFATLVNSFVHFLMYSYYLAACLGWQVSVLFLFFGVFKPNSIC
jgi:hypothetical protein